MWLWPIDHPTDVAVADFTRDGAPVKTKHDAPPDAAPEPADRLEGAPPGPNPAELPGVVDWTEITLTSRCNQRCFFCYEDGRDTATEPSLERVKELLRATREQAEQVVFCGREVLLRRDMVQIVAHASSLGLRVVVFSNGQALARPGLVEQLAEAGCSGIAVSFHFPDRETFVRGARSGGRGFSRTLEGLRRVRDHNLAHPGRPLGLSTETDMFALNSGRLAEMRAVLRQALDPAPWSMRLACLLPSRVHDIGLDHVLDGLERRRQELAEFIATHPPELPLGFVKLPLCILPLEQAHRCLDVQYVHSGSRLTFNHLHGERIQDDPFSASVGRDIPGLLREHPYRWLCRCCEMAPLCRFERVDWETTGFAPTRLQRPTPFRAPEAAGWWDGVDLPARTGTAAEVLSRLGPSGQAGQWVTALHRVLGGRAFPEEEIFAQLAGAGAGEPRLVDLHAEQEPLAVVTLQLGDEQVRLHLGLPGPGEEKQALHAVVGYLNVRELTSATPAARRRCLEHLGRLKLPELSGWAGDRWFDARRARLLQAAWRALGEGLWPELGRFGPWQTRGAALGPAPELVLELIHPRGHVMALRCALDEAQAGAAAGSCGGLGSRLVQASVSGAGPAGDLDELQQVLGAALLGGARQVRTAPGPEGDAPWSARLLHARWRRDPSPAPDGPPAAQAPPPAVSSLCVVVQPRTGEQPYRFHVAPWVPGQPFFKRQGDSILWYTHGRLDDGATAWARVLLAVMRHLQRCPPGPDTVPRWRKLIGRAAERSGLGADGCQVQWREGAGPAL